MLSENRESCPPVTETPCQDGDLARIGKDQELAFSLGELFYSRDLSPESTQASCRDAAIFPRKQEQGLPCMVGASCQDRIGRSVRQVSRATARVSLLAADRPCPTWKERDTRIPLNP